tara:strand:+ start:496 stop:1386 length:891 start_codon:yes stop_codon:yes gene_type:complete
MAFIGNQPVEQYSSIAKQDITGNGGTTYTLNAAVTSPEDIEVFINNVRQEPSTSYTVSGTTLTLTEALLSTEDCYVVYQGRTVGTKAPGDNTVGTGKIQANAVTSAKLDTNIAVSGNLDANVLRTASIKHTNNTAAMTIDSAGRMLFPNQVRFHAAGIPTDSTHNVYLQFGNVTNGMMVDSTHYAASSGTFTAPVAGTYMFYVGCIGANASTVYRLYPRKNNVDLYSPDASLHLRLDTRSTGGADEYASNASLVWMHTLAASDTMRVYSTVDDGSSNLYRSSGTKEYTYFGGYLLG